jgi:hypothetical protein
LVGGDNAVRIATVVDALCIGFFEGALELDGEALFVVRLGDPGSQGIDVWSRARATRRRCSQ